MLGFQDCVKDAVNGSNQEQQEHQAEKQPNKIIEVII